MTSLWLPSLLARIGQRPNETEEDRLLRLVGVVSLLVGGTFVLLLCGFYWLFDEVIAASVAFVYLIMLLTSGVLWNYGVLGLSQWAWLMRVLALLNPFLSTWLLGGLINSGLVATWGSFKHAGVCATADRALDSRLSGIARVQCSGSTPVASDQQLPAAGDHFYGGI